MRLSVFLMVVLAAGDVCDSGSRRRREAQEQYLRQKAELERQQDSSIATTRASIRRELPQREAQWASHGITHYRLAVRVGCYCEPPPLAVVTVRGDSTTVLNALDQQLPERQADWLAFSVSRLFDELRRMVADSNWRIYAGFDSTYGFPNYISTDDRRTSHAGYQARVEAFEILGRRSPRSRPRKNY